SNKQKMWRSKREKTTMTCERCGKTSDDDIIDALGEAVLCEVCLIAIIRNWKATAVEDGHAATSTDDAELSEGERLLAGRHLQIAAMEARKFVPKLTFPLGNPKVPSPT